MPKHHLMVGTTVPRNEHRIKGSVDSSLMPIHGAFQELLIVEIRVPNVLLVWLRSATEAGASGGAYGCIRRKQRRPLGSEGANLSWRRCPVSLMRIGAELWLLWRSFRMLQSLVEWTVQNSEVTWAILDCDVSTMGFLCLLKCLETVSGL